MPISIISPRSRASRAALVGALVAALPACAAIRSESSGVRWREDGRQARDLPTLFLADTTASPRALSDVRACTVRLVDPRDGTRLTLVRSQEVGANNPAGTTPVAGGQSGQSARPAATQPPAGREFRGDYRIEGGSGGGRYGVGPGELLRLDCVSGRPLGIVRAGD
jgi:hypothetical protein